MRALKFVTSAFLLLLCLVSYGQSTSSSEKKNVYYVQTTHTPEQCLATLTEIKAKGEQFLQKFEFGCMSGNHTGYAFLEGTSDDNVRKMLPTEAQVNAKIQKVDKFTSEQIEQLHKEHQKK